MMPRVDMFSLKPLVLLLVLAVVVQATCAASCIHPFAGKPPAPANSSQASEHCHHGSAPVKSSHAEHGSACSHRHISEDRPQIAVQDTMQPAAMISVAAVRMPSEFATRAMASELSISDSPQSAPPLATLRI